MQSETIGKLAEALAKAQAQMENAKKDSVNPHFKSKYADIASVIDAIREPLSKHGLAFVQYAEEENGIMYLITKLIHSSGEWISGKMKLLITKQDMQGLGSAITYARRYGLSAIVGLAQDDDDGNAAALKFFRAQNVPNGTNVMSETKSSWAPDFTKLKNLRENAGWTQDKVIDFCTSVLHQPSIKNLTEIQFNQLCQTLDEEVKLALGQEGQEL